MVYAVLLSLGVRDKANSSKEDRPFLGSMHVISSSYLSWADASSLESAQGPESTAFGLYSLSRHRLIVRVLVPVPGARCLIRTLLWLYASSFSHRGSLLSIIIFVEHLHTVTRLAYPLKHCL